VETLVEEALRLADEMGIELPDDAGAASGQSGAEPAVKQTRPTSTEIAGPTVTVH
jgi:hypothetical protein